MNQDATRIAMERLHGLLEDLTDMGERNLVDLIHNQFRTGSHGKLYAATCWERLKVGTMTPSDAMEKLLKIAANAKETGE